MLQPVGARLSPLVEGMPAVALADAEAMAAFRIDMQLRGHAHSKQRLIQDDTMLGFGNGIVSASS